MLQRFVPASTRLAVMLFRLSVIGDSCPMMLGRLFIPATVAFLFWNRGLSPPRHLLPPALWLTNWTRSSVTFADILGTHQGSFATYFARLGLDVSIPQVRAYFSEPMPRQQFVNAMRTLMRDVISSDRRFEKFLQSEKFMPLLNEVLDGKIPEMTAVMIASVEPDS